MKKINAAMERFVLRHPGFGIPGLMRYVVLGQAVVYILMMFSNSSAVSFLAFNWNAILQGEVWRLVTFILLPEYNSFLGVIGMILFLYLYYMIGTALEREWGTAKFTLYYFSGVLLTLIIAIVTALVTGRNVVMSGTDYVNLSMFFAFAMLYPDMQFLIFFIIPVKVKWLAWLDAAFFAASILMSLLSLDFVGALIPIIAILNFFVFFWTDITDLLSRRRGMARQRGKTIQFRSAAREQMRREARQGYRHKCAVCGRTDTEHPELEFRYCSRCEGYHCFCQDHIFNHEHFTK